MRAPSPTHPGPACWPHRTRAAFTLIEVLIAIGVIVALIAVAVPTLVLSFGDRKLEAEAERLAAAMSGLRAESVRQRETLALFLEPATGDYGGALVIGPLEAENEEPFVSPDEQPFGWGGPEEADAIPTRRVFEAERPLKLGERQPNADLELGLVEPPDDESAGRGFAGPGDEIERIRIAVCSASGQILASRPLWLSDERAMFRVEVGRGVGNAVISGPRVILTDPLLADDAEDDDASDDFDTDPDPPANPLPGVDGGGTESP